MTDTNGEMDSATRDKLLTQGYTMAMKDLREAHQDEFNGYRVVRSAELGVEWTPRKSKEDAALEQIEALLTEIPGLAEKLAERLAETLAKGVQDA